MLLKELLKAIHDSGGAHGQPVLVHAPALRAFAPDARCAPLAHRMATWNLVRGYAHKKRDPLPGPRSFLPGLPGAASAAEAASAAA